MSIFFVLPLSIPTVEGKRMSINLNQYRNAHHYLLNCAKVNFKSHVAPQVHQALQGIGSPVDVYQITYTVFKGSKRRMDVPNVCSIADKFFADVLVEMGLTEDDNSDHLKRTIYQYGGIDRKNPRIEAELERLDNE